MHKQFLITIIVLTLFACSQPTIETQKTTQQAPTTSAENTSTQSDQTPKTKSATKKIVFFGDSLTAAYGLSEEEGYPNLIQEKLNSANLDYEVISAGLSGDTTTGGNDRIDWILEQPMDIFVLELGANDAFRGTDTKIMHKNLQSIIDKVKGKYPECHIILAGMLAPPNLGEAYTSSFKNVFKKLAKDNELAFIPFLLDGVAGDKKLNLPDGIHPTAEGYKIVAQNVWEVLKEFI